MALQEALGERLPEKAKRPVKTVMMPDDSSKGVLHQVCAVVTTAQLPPARFSSSVIRRDRNALGGSHPWENSAQNLPEHQQQNDAATPLSVVVMETRV